MKNQTANVTRRIVILAVFLVETNKFADKKIE